jgi:hypothetical protein
MSSLRYDYRKNIYTSRSKYESRSVNIKSVNDRVLNLLYNIVHISFPLSFGISVYLSKALKNNKCTELRIVS